MLVHQKSLKSELFLKLRQYFPLIVPIIQGTLLTLLPDFRSEGRVQGFCDDFCGIWKVRKLNSFNFPTKSEFDEKITFCILTRYEAYRKDLILVKKSFFFFLVVSFPQGVVPTARS